MPKCTYCGRNYEIPRGLTLVDIVGKVKYLCSSKCRKYFLMNRRKGKWAKTKIAAIAEIKAAEEVEKIKTEKPDKK